MKVQLGKDELTYTGDCLGFGTTPCLGLFLYDLMGRIMMISVRKRIYNHTDIMSLTGGIDSESERSGSVTKIAAFPLRVRSRTFSGGLKNTSEPVVARLRTMQRLHRGIILFTLEMG